MAVAGKLLGVTGAASAEGRMNVTRCVVGQINEVRMGGEIEIRVTSTSCLISRLVGEMANTTGKNEV